MIKDISIHHIVQQLLDLQNKYARTPRKNVTGERLSYALVSKKEIDLADPSICEPLIEHIGHLPIIATFLYPLLTHKSEVDIGKVLVMISIHDIAETETGDVLSYDKDDGHARNEDSIARKLISPDLISYYEEFEAQESFDAKFAKAVDALAPILHEIDMPKLTLKRFAFHNFNSAKVESKKRKYFEWDQFLEEVFATVMEAYAKLEKGEQNGFRVLTDLN